MQNGKFMFLVVPLLLGVGFLFGCEKTNNTPNGSEVRKGVYTKISPKQAKEMMDKGDPFILVDVRTEGEFRESRISGSILIPNTEIKNRAQKELPDKNALIFVYCRSGARSSGAARELVSMGYTNVYDIGGIMDWPYGTVSGK